jgi:hypothetical protein
MEFIYRVHRHKQMRKQSPPPPFRENGTTGLNLLPKQKAELNFQLTHRVGQAEMTLRT